MNAWGDLKTYSHRYVFFFFFKKVNSDSEKKSDSQSKSTPPLIKQAVATDKTSQDGKATHRKQQAVNGFSATILAKTYETNFSVSVK